MKTPMLPLREPTAGSGAAAVTPGDELLAREEPAALASTTTTGCGRSRASGLGAYAGKGGEAGAVRPEATCTPSLRPGAVEGRPEREASCASRGETYISGSATTGCSTTDRESSMANGSRKDDEEGAAMERVGSGEEGGLGEGASRRFMRASPSSPSSGAGRSGADVDVRRPSAPGPPPSVRPSIRSADPSSVELEPAGRGDRSGSLAVLDAVATDAIDRFDTLCDESPRTDERCELALRGRYLADDERHERALCRLICGECDGEKGGCEGALGARCDDDDEEAEGGSGEVTRNSIVLGVMGPSVSSVLERETPGGADVTDEGECIVAFGSGSGAGGSRRTRVRAGASLASECSDMRRP